MAVQILLRRGLAADWVSANPVLGAGELGFETDTKKFKIGDGTTAWNSITAYVAGPESLRLQDLVDVSGTAPSTGQVLKWNGSAWAPAADNGGGGAGTTYTIAATSATGGANISLAGSDSTTDSVKLAAGANVTITQTDADTITIAATGGGGGGASNIDDLGDVVLNNPSNGQVLKYNGSAWINGTDSGATNLDGLSDVIISGSPSTGQVLKFDGSVWTNSADETGVASLSLDGLTDVQITGATTGQVLKYNGTSWVNDTDAGGSGSLQSRTTVNGTSASLEDGASGPINITGYKAYALLKIQTSAAAWVRIYTHEAARQADASRLEGVDPTPGSGVLAEVITTGADTILISPGTFGFNNESPVTTNIPIRVTNKSGGTAAITVTLTVLQLEA